MGADILLPVQMDVKYDPSMLPLGESNSFRFPFSFAERWRYNWVKSHVVPWLSEQSHMTYPERLKLCHYYLTTNDETVVGNNLVEQYGDAPGSYRNHDPIFINLIGDQLIYVCPHSTQINSLVNELDSTSKKFGENHTIEQEAWKYLIMLGIHPFSNVNGRVARLMMDEGLIKHGNNALPWERDRLFMNTIRLLKQRFFSVVALRVSGQIDTKIGRGNSWSMVTGEAIMKIITGELLSDEMSDIIMRVGESVRSKL